MREVVGAFQLNLPALPSGASLKLALAGLSPSTLSFVLA
jgi:hypothetical protein